MKVNHHALQLENSYLFSEIAKRLRTFQAENPGRPLLKCSIGDVTRPLPRIIADALKNAAEEMAHAETFRGYGAEQGEPFLREAIAGYYGKRGLQIDPGDIFISDGAKSDTGNIGDILSSANVIGVTDPVYPVYVDTNTMGGRDIRYIPCNEANGFTGDIPAEKLDVVYLCFPNNPTGAVITREGLQRWVDYALRNDCLILYDAAYEAFISDAAIPHSIYEIEGANQCAIEFRSFSKTAGFTGVRCGYTIIPNELKVNSLSGERVALNGIWDRRQCSKFNGASYISQRGAEAVFSAEGQKQIRATIDYYMANARIIRQSLQGFGLQVFGGQNAPYIWVRTPNGTDSWSFFDRLLREAQVVTTPGAGFGAAGEGYIRITAFGTHKSSIEAMERVKKCL